MSCDIEEIKALIQLGHEGGYWDFKKQWYDESKLGDLLHDIICMANNLENRDAYIIIGINESNGCKVVDVQNDKNRRNTQQITDFIKDKKFLGDVRPVVRVESLKIDDKNVDVIVIKSTHNTPYILREDYRNIYAWHIYTRVQDTNTPKNSSADVDSAEKLYRKRFMIDEPPMARMEAYLADVNNWSESENSVAHEYYYARSRDQFSIRLRHDSGHEQCEFWSLMFPDSDRESNSLQAIELVWSGIVLSSEYQYAPLDGGRAHCVMPEVDSIEYNETYFSYFFVIKGTLRHRLYEFVWRKMYQSDLMRYKKAIEDHFIIFNNKQEKDDFKSYLDTNIKSVAKQLLTERNLPENQGLFSEGMYYGFEGIDTNDYIDSHGFVEIYDEWKRQQH